MTSSQCAAAMLCFGVVECNVLPIICVAMRHFFGIAGVAADNVTNSSAARPAQHPIIFRQYSAGDAFSQCLSTHAVDAFFQQCSATELTGSEEDLLNSLCHVAEMVQAVLPRLYPLLPGTPPNPSRGAAHPEHHRPPGRAVQTPIAFATPTGGREPHHAAPAPMITIIYSGDIGARMRAPVKRPAPPSSAQVVLV